MTREEFRDAYTVYLENVGIKPIPLMDEFGAPYKGVLMTDPAAPWRYHVFGRGVQHDMITHHLPLSSGAPMVLGEEHKLPDVCLGD